MVLNGDKCRLSHSDREHIRRGGWLLPKTYFCRISNLFLPKNNSTVVVWIIYEKRYRHYPVSNAHKLINITKRIKDIVIVRPTPNPQPLKFSPHLLHHFLISLSLSLTTLLDLLKVRGCETSRSCCHGCVLTRPQSGTFGKF